MSANPVEHVLDHYVAGLSASGEWTWLSEFPAGWMGAGANHFVPMRVGPFDLVLTQHMLGISLVSLLLFVTATVTAARVETALAGDKPPRGRLANMFEALILFVRNDIVLPNMGQHGVRYLPLFLTFFFFILFANLIGIVPGVGTPTGNINVTFTLAGIVFVGIFVLGSFEQGGPHIFLKHLLPSGLPAWLMPFMFVIELVGPVAKAFALMMRLFANMIAGHIVMAALFGLVVVFHTIAIPIGIVSSVAVAALGALEIFICVLQAYIFTLLAVLFIGMAVHPEH